MANYRWSDVVREHGKTIWAITGSASYREIFSDVPHHPVPPIERYLLDLERRGLMKILVAGGAGIWGLKVIPKILERGYCLMWWTFFGSATHLPA